MPGLLDFLGFGDGMPTMNNAGDFGAELGLLNPATLQRMRALAAGGREAPTMASTGGAGPAFRMPGGLPFSNPNTAVPGQDPVGPLVGQSPGLGIGVGPTIASTGGREPGPSLTPSQATPSMEFSGPPQDVPGSPAPPITSSRNVPVAAVGGVPAALAQPYTPPPPTPAALTPPSKNVLQKIDELIKRNPNVFLGLGAGFAGGRSIGEGISGAARGVAAGSAADREARSYNATVDALMAKGLSREDAEAAAGSPHLLQAQIAKLYGVPTFQKITDAAGNERLVLTYAPGGTVQNPIEVPPNARRVASFEEALALPKGAIFIDPITGRPKVR